MNKNTWIIFALGLVLPATTVSAASTKAEVLELKEQVQALQAGQEAMQEDLEEIKKLLKEGARPAAPSAPEFKEQVEAVGPSPYKGDAAATVTLIEYSDYQCPFCSRHYREVMPGLVEEYVNTGKLKYVMREHPIASIHPNATNASLAALCAHDQGKYWEMHNIMFDNQAKLGAAELKSYAAEIGLDTAKFDKCLDTRDFETWVNSDLTSANDLGLRGTPAFVLGLTDPNDPDKVLLTEYIRGAQPLANFKQVIDDLLDEAEGGD